MRILLYLFFYVSIVSGSYGQLSFEDQTTTYLGNLDFRSGNAGAIADLNNDGRDDLIILNKGDRMFIGYNQGANMPMLWLEGPKVSFAREYHCVITDLENDGLCEIITAGPYTNTKVYKQNADGNYVFQSLLTTNILAQGGNAVDLNNDGLLDYFVCSDESTNVIAMNNGNGLEIVDTLIDFTTTPVSDMSGNYASEWVDVDNDGDLDLHLAMCRAGVNDPSDPRRINRMFVNDDGVFTDQANARGLAIGRQSWTGSFGDVDNDGDFDLLVTNHGEPHQLMLNDGTGIFMEATDALKGLATFAIQSAWADFDNDGRSDLFISAFDFHHILLNKETGFEIVTKPLTNSAAKSFTIGDINDDGKLDLMVYNSSNINSPGTLSDQLFINTTDNTNNFLKVRLKGNSSNILGIGALVKLYSGGKIQSRVVKGGEGYGVTHTYAQHFGLGAVSEVDSIVVNWPSGIKDVITSNAINTTIIIEEGTCISLPIDISSTSNILCGDSIELTGPLGYDSYLWSNGVSMASSILVSTGGVYYLQAVDSNGCVSFSNHLELMSGVKTSSAIAPLKQDMYCKGEEAVLSVHGLLGSWTWSDGTTLPTTSVSSEGWQVLMGTDMCQNEFRDSVYLEFLEPRPSYIQGDTVPLGSMAQLIALGKDIQWYTSFTSPIPFFNGDTLRLANVNESRSYYVTETELKLGTAIHGGKFIEENMNHYRDGINQQFFINVFDSIYIDSMTLVSKRAGIRKLQVLRDDLSIVVERDLFIQEGRRAYKVDMIVPPGLLYFFGFDEVTNLQNLGTMDPQLSVNEGDNFYPYEFGSLMELVSSTQGRMSYPYMYDVKVAPYFGRCEGERQEIKVILDRDVATNDYTTPVSIFPNPTQGLVYLSGIEAVELIEIFTLTGKKVRSWSKTEVVDFTSLEAGIYLLQVWSPQGTMVYRVHKI